MHFESLANEILLTIFTYLNGIEVFRAFKGLNSRLDELLSSKFQIYDLDFRSVSKNDFEDACRWFLKTKAENVVSLHFSDSEETPNLSRTFLSCGFSISQFINLKTVSLYNIQSYDTFIQLVAQCFHLVYLTHFNVVKCCFDYNRNEVQCLMNHIWQLPTVTHCVLNLDKFKTLVLTDINVISSSIKSLVLDKITCDFRDLAHLGSHTLNMQRLSINLLYGFPDQELQNPILSVFSAKLVYHGCKQALINLFQNLPNLVYLKLQTFDIYCDGHEWANILVNYLSKVKVFRLKMNLNFPSNEDINQQVHTLLDTFRTSFWLMEHHWYVRCDWNPFNLVSFGALYTLPYTFDDCFYFDAIYSKSTCLTANDYWIYDRVRIVSHKHPNDDYAKDPMVFSARFSNVRHLKLNLPFDEKFWSCIPSLDRLVSISVTLQPTDHACSQLQELLIKAKQLYSLKFFKMQPLPKRFYKIASASIRRVSFITKSKTNILCFDVHECALLVKSPLILQCEVLIIGVKIRSSIVEFFNIMRHIRCLIVCCEDDEYNPWNMSTINDELIQWLETRLSSKHMISRDEKQTHLLRIWIERKE